MEKTGCETVYALRQRDGKTETVRRSQDGDKLYGAAEEGIDRKSSHAGKFCGSILKRKREGDSILMVLQAWQPLSFLRERNFMPDAQTNIRHGAVCAVWHVQGARIALQLLCQFSDRSPGGGTVLAAPGD